MNLQGKNAVVTGGASGIGKGICLRLARDGADVAIFDLNLSASEKVVTEIERAGGRAAAFDVNVTNRTQIDKAVGAIRERFGVVQILVNSAGIAELVPVVGMNEEQWDQMIAVHLKGTFNCTQAFLGGMIDAGWGRVITIASVAGLSGAPGLVHYSAAKAGVIGFTKALAREVGRKGITVNAIAPGIVDTQLLWGAQPNLDLTKSALRVMPIKRAGTPEDIAAACAYLVSEEAGYCTGQVLSPNGGIYT